MLFKKNNKLQFLKKKFDSNQKYTLLNNQVGFIYFVTSFSVFNFYKSFFYNIKSLTITNFSKTIINKFFRLNNESKYNSVYLSKSIIVGSYSLEFLFDFNINFINKGVLIVGVLYNKMFYSFSDFCLIVNQIKIKLLNVLSCLKIYKRLFIVIRSLFLNKKQIKIVRDIL